MSKSDKKRKKLCEEIKRRQAALRDALSSKRNGAKEINLAEEQEKIRKLMRQLEELE